MPIHNADVSDIFNRMADLLEIEGANQFRVRAYRNAARIVAGLPQSVADMVKRDLDLTQFPGIGKDLAGKIEEIVRTGSLSQLEELEARLPVGLSSLMKVAGLGPKRVQTLHEKLGINDMADLKQAALAGKISKLPGFAEKTEQMLIKALEAKVDKGKERTKIVVAEEIASSLVGYLENTRGIMNIEVAGSYRRKLETVGDLDILVTCREAAKVMEHFVSYEDVSRVVSKGKTRSTVLLRSGLQVDLRVVAQASYGAALHYFTGSKAHNIAIRTLGIRRKLKLNEYGVFKGKNRIAGKTEEEVYASVDLPYIEPELRENWGEIEAAQESQLPHLISVNDIKGDLHVHTKATDGHHSPEEMAEAARDRGYVYLAITDHSKRLSMTHGFDARRLAKRNREIDRLNKKLKGIILLKSIEMDILEDGSLDLPDEILKELDLTVCSVHSKFHLSRQKQTERIIRAMDNPYFNILAHPTGRLINERDPYDVDIERLMEAARERGCLMEVNAHPDRLDLSGMYCKMAKEMGVKLVISTDAHSKTDLDFIRFGVAQGRRGWLEPDDVLNTRSWEELKKLLKRS